MADFHLIIAVSVVTVFCQKIIGTRISNFSDKSLYKGIRLGTSDIMFVF